ncbi:MAG: DotH/IcmK family type IV secretion protein [Coxiellaceae bacterium]|jgi:intracellular multiplication protein IcmK|nr:DotH/IcmK family type IV secretion protein [Coxiellaceae bacterium]
MKVFLILLVTIFICWQSVFAVPRTTAKSQREQKESQEKLEQLQQLLERVVKSGDTSMPIATSTSENVPTSEQESFVSVANSSSAFASDADQSQVSQTSQNINDKVTGTESLQPNLYDEAFSSVVNQLLPMSPPQIAKLREVFAESQQAAAIPPGIPSRPTSTSLLVDQSVGASPPVIRLGPGIITSLVFVDGTGQPWPIEAYNIGDPTAANIQWNRKNNILFVQSATFYKRFNLAVILRDLPTPVMITLISGQAAVDYRVDLRVPGFGPNAVFVQSGIPESANPILLDVLNGIPPRKSKTLRVSGGDCQAWLLNKKLYLRTRLNIISPGWQSIMSSIDGTHAYQLQPAPVILALKNDQDKILTLMLEGLE